jgi:hypothetical protein
LFSVVCKVNNDEKRTPCNNSSLVDGPIMVPVWYLDTNNLNIRWSDHGASLISGYQQPEHETAPITHSKEHPPEVLQNKTYHSWFWAQPTSRLLTTPKHWHWTGRKWSNFTCFPQMISWNTCIGLHTKWINKSFHVLTQEAKGFHDKVTFCLLSTPPTLKMTQLKRFSLFSYEW